MTIQPANAPASGSRRVNMARGLPSPAQVALSRPLLCLPGNHAFSSVDGIDWLNYGDLQGLAEVRERFGPLLLGLPASQVAVGGNSSLELMHQAISHAWIKGFPGHPPWSTLPCVRFLCPEPGYDRHFAICEYFGVELVPVRMRQDGPDMDEVEQLIADDPTIRGMWCVPRHSNPSGAIYSRETIDRLARMAPAAEDFRIFCDNAYVMHDFEGPALADITLQSACARSGHEDRVLVFASTSKMSIPGAGLSFFGASPRMLRWWLEGRQAATIGPDKVNQVRHLQFFRSQEILAAHMRQHGQLLRARFDVVLRVFQEQLSHVAGVDWSTPSGGYFICLRVRHGQAQRVARLAADAGVTLTPPGSTHCHGIDPEDRYLRIAPSHLDVDDAAHAAGVIAQAVLAASEESGQACGPAEPDRTGSGPGNAPAS